MIRTPHQHLVTRLSRSLAAGALAVVLTGCATMNLDSILKHGENLARSFSQEATPEKQQAMGDEAAALLLGAAPLVKNAALQNYVNRLGLWVALQAGPDDTNWRFGVIDTDSVNAFAAPSGYVFITRGLLARLENESELAGVLAHEIAHVLQGHYVNTMIKRDRVAALGDLTQSALRGGGKGDWGPLVNLSRGVYGSGLDKGDEYQADRMGVVLAARAGYDPYGLPRVLQMYATTSGQGEFELLFSTHPGADARLDELASVMGDKFDSLEKSGVKNTAAFPRYRTNAKTGGRGTR
ncbi:M48 family metalloprotease [Alcaligenaceae bacterium]|nr:M48 family metalloprotease [Alcaligenaceae bacterium]